MTSSIFVSIWAHMGFYTLIVLAGLQAIPPNLYEAAEMDGTSRERTFFRITLPLLMPNLLVVFILASIKGVQTFDEIYVLTGGGPGTSTSLIVQYIFTTGFASSGSVQNFGTRPTFGNHTTTYPAIKNVKSTLIMKLDTGTTCAEVN